MNVEAPAQHFLQFHSYSHHTILYTIFSRILRSSVRGALKFQRSEELKIDSSTFSFFLSIADQSFYHIIFYFLGHLLYFLFFLFFFPFSFSSRRCCGSGRERLNRLIVWASVHRSRNVFGSFPNHLVSNVEIFCYILEWAARSIANFRQLAPMQLAPGQPKNIENIGIIILI